MKDDLKYSTTDCFETFTFPPGVLDSPQHPPSNPDFPLETFGRGYYEYRVALMVKNDEGLTATYNRFHDPHERSAELKQLRELHAATDRAVLRAYGWHDLAESATCEFLLDYEEADDESGKPSKRKKPWRLRWPDEFRDEVLARLLAVDAERARDEAFDGNKMRVRSLQTASRTVHCTQKAPVDAL